MLLIFPAVSSCSCTPRTSAARRSATGRIQKRESMTYTTSLDGKSVVQVFVDPQDVIDRVAELMFWLRDHEKQV